MIPSYNGLLYKPVFTKVFQMNLEKPIWAWRREWATRCNFNFQTKDRLADIPKEFSAQGIAAAVYKNTFGNFEFSPLTKHASLKICITATVPWRYLVYLTAIFHKPCLYQTFTIHERKCSYSDNAYLSSVLLLYKWHEQVLTRFADWRIVLHTFVCKEVTK